MKSIMEEASSIAKAIETAWNRAGQPTEFSVKVLELPQTSFFGLKTSKSAKVAFFFNEATVTVKPKDSTPQSRQSQRPVTLRQPGSRPEHDQRRSDYAKASSDRQHQGQRPEHSEAREQREPREPSDYAKGGVYPERAQRVEGTDRQDNRQPRESDYAKATTDKRDNRNFEQRQDQRNRPQGPRRSDYAKSSERPDDRPRRPDYAKSSSDRHDDRRPRHSDYAKGGVYPERAQRVEGTDRDGERSEHSSYSQEPRENWTPEMAQIAQEWIKETLVLMGKPDITVNTQVSHNYLKINLSAPVLDDARQEETQLKSWGMLAMEAVREKMGKPLRSLRIVLESPRS